MKIIAVDFDGTLCENKWPNIGEPNYELIEYLRMRQRAGDKIILWTCRVDEKLEEALDWCALHDLYFDAVNENIQEAIDLFGTDTRKIFAHEYIDDLMCTKFELPFYKDRKRMTYREKLRLESPDDVDSNYIGGCFGCPGDYWDGCVTLSNNISCCPSEETCTRCWDQIAED